MFCTEYYGIKNNTYICMPVILRLFGFTFYFFLAGNTNRSTCTLKVLMAMLSMT